MFTSGGTEADALAVTGLGAGRRSIIGATEHPAVRAAAAGAAEIAVIGTGWPISVRSSGWWRRAGRRWCA